MNNLTFWDTVRGNQLADTLIRCLPKLTRKKTQYTIVLEKEDPFYTEEDIIEQIEKEIKEGSCFVSKVEDEKKVLLIFEN